MKKSRGPAAGQREAWVSKVLSWPLGGDFLPAHSQTHDFQVSRPLPGPLRLCYVGSSVSSLLARNLLGQVAFIIRAAQVSGCGSTAQRRDAPFSELGPAHLPLDPYQGKAVPGSCVTITVRTQHGVQQTWLCPYYQCTQDTESLSFSFL